MMFVLFSYHHIFTEPGFLHKMKTDMISFLVSGAWFFLKNKIDWKPGHFNELNQI